MLDEKVQVGPAVGNLRGAIAPGVAMLVAAIGSGCGGIVTSDPLDGSAGGPQGDQGTGAGPATGSGGTHGGAPRFEEQNWRSYEDYGGAPVPFIVNASIHGVGPDDVFVAGYVAPATSIQGFIDRRTATGWAPLFETVRTLGVVWAASRTEVFGANADWIVVTDGTDEGTKGWSLGDVRVRSIFGFAGDDVFAVGDNGLILRYDGGGWGYDSDVTVAHLRAVWGSGPDDVFAVGAGGAIVHKSSSGWATMPSPTSVDLNGVWGSGPDDVYVVGGSETQPGHVILHYDGGDWAVVDVGDERNTTLLGIAGRSAWDVCAVGGLRNAEGDSESLVLHFDGATWTELPSTASTFLWDLWPRTADEYLLVGPEDALIAMRM